jgi:hypothetical protein
MSCLAMVWKQYADIQPDGNASFPVLIPEETYRRLKVLPPPPKDVTRTRTCDLLA